MEELKMRRAKALVRREVKRATLMHQLETKRDEVSRNGVRSLLFSGNTVAGLKKADYAFLGYKVIALLIKLYSRKNRR
jgi:heterodisulfide reductase subunit A-like polyferredoxin